MRVLLTGANGFLGKQLAKDLLQEGHELILVVRSAKKLDRFLKDITCNKQKESIQIIEGQITSHHLGLSEEILDGLEGKVDAIYHSAALLSFNEADEALTYDVNVNGTKHTLEFALRIKCNRFLYVSTAYTIGKEVIGAETLYSKEREFVNSYERTKCEAEHIVVSYSNRLSIAILRPAIIIGDSRTGMADTSFGLYGILKSLKVLKRKMSRKENLEEVPFRLIMDGNTASNIVPIDYVSSVLVAALHHSRNGDILNITNPNPPKQEKVVQLIKEYMQLPNIEIMEAGSEHLLRDDERAFNQPLAVFTNYLSRDIYFPCDSTAYVLEQANKPLLNMDDQMLERIIKGYLETSR